MTPLDQLSQMRLHFFHERPKIIFHNRTMEQWNNGPIKNNWSDIGKFVNMSHFVKIYIKGIFLKFHNFLIS